MSVVRVKYPADITKLETALHLARRQTSEACLCSGSPSPHSTGPFFAVRLGDIVALYAADGQ